MLAAKFRLSRADVFRIKEHSQRTSTPDFSAQMTGNTLPYSRFGVVVSRKIDHRAVVRNLLRRRIYSSLENTKLVGQDILFVPKPTMLKLTYEEIRAHIDSFLSALPRLP